MSNFQKNLKKLCNKYTQKFVAEKTGFSQSSVNNYISKSSEPSIAFLIALKDAFGISVDDFLFAEIDESEEVSFDRFIGNYIVYYYNNNSYKGEVHTNLSNTLNYGVISIFKENAISKDVVVCGTFMKEKSEAVKLLKKLNEDVVNTLSIHEAYDNLYKGEMIINDQSFFFNLANKDKEDRAFMIFNNPPSKTIYSGGVGTINTVARGREHNPCVQFAIIAKKVIDKPDGEIYNCLKFDDYVVNFDYAIKDIIDLFKRLFVSKNELSTDLTENQKIAIIKNNLEYHFNDILDANAFRFAKVSNKEDDMVYKLIKEGVDV